MVSGQYIMEKKNSGLIFDSALGLMKETFVVTEPGNRLFPTHKSFVPGQGMFWGWERNPGRDVPETRYRMRARLKAVRNSVFDREINMSVYIVSTNWGWGGWESELLPIWFCGICCFCSFCVQLAFFFFFFEIQLFIFQHILFWTSGLENSRAVGEKRAHVRSHNTSRAA